MKKLHKLTWVKSLGQTISRKKILFENFCSYAYYIVMQRISLFVSSHNSKVINMRIKGSEFDFINISTYESVRT